MATGKFMMMLVLMLVILCCAATVSAQQRCSTDEDCPKGIWCHPIGLYCTIKQQQGRPGR